MMEYKLYQVGGSVRDEILGLPVKDLDYVAVITDPDKYLNPYAEFVKQLVREGYKIYLETPECFTIRAKFPPDHVFKNIDADFVIARKELYYKDGTRTPVTTYGTLFDDLQRRDFTVNTLAKDQEGNLIDFFGGLKDLKKGILRTPIDTMKTFDDDPLRIVRAIRFTVTKNMFLSKKIVKCIAKYDPDKMKVVSKERIREELYKMFKHNTVLTIDTLYEFKMLNNKLFLKLFDVDLWLKPTFENK